ncbi:hypothetical protein LCGC14_1605820 [marine sediment metagenome]|uniref:Uncharacterized protein n=1 Tax=marine sediment metagenome TaxID=412755 RepID=A0A0F9I9S4_9ZZZZ
MGLKEQLKKLVTSQAKQVDEPLKILDRMTKTADAARRAGKDITAEKE